MKAKLNRITKIFLIIIVLLVIAYDVWVIIKGNTGVSVSFVIHQWSKEYPIVTLSVGAVLGHWFWPIIQPEKKE